MLSRFEIPGEDELLHDVQQRAAHSGRVLAIHRSGRVLIVPYVPRGWDLLRTATTQKQKPTPCSSRH